MKRKLFCGLMLISMGTMLTGCHMKHEWADATCTEPRTCTVGGETEGEALGHTWVDATCEEAKHCSKCGETEGAALGHTLTEATFKEAAVCTVCGKTEGEPKKSYFEEHGENVPDAPVACTVNFLIYDSDNPECQMTTDGTWEQLNCYSEPAEEEGYQLIHLELCASSQGYYDAAQDMWYNYNEHLTDIYDWYTGRWLSSRYMYDNNIYYYDSDTLEIDGVGYDISYTNDVQWEWSGWIWDDNGNGTDSVKYYYAYTFQVPEGYDGLVFAAIPDNEYIGSDTETDYETDIEDGASDSGTDEEYARYAFDEGHYVDGTKFFRINREGMVPEKTAE